MSSTFERAYSDRLDFRSPTVVVEPRVGLPTTAGLDLQRHLTVKQSDDGLIIQFTETVTVESFPATSVAQRR